MFGIGKSRQVVAVDIGSSSVKALELKKTGKGIEVDKLGVELLAPDIVVDGAIVDTGAVSTTIVKVFDENKIKTKGVATSVSGHSVIVKRLSMAPMSEEELIDAIQSEASQHIPFDIAEVNLDHQTLETDPNTGNMDVLLVAAKKDKILNYTNVLSLAGKTAAVVDIDAFALQNAYEFNYEPAENQTVALLNIGASVMNINIVRGRVPLFTRDVSVGGMQYTDSLQKELDLSFEDAERVKMGKSVPGVSDEARLPVLKSVSEIIILEIQKTFDFFRATAPGEHIQKIYVAGGSTRVPGLLDLLKQEFSIPVEELNPFRKILYDPNSQHGEIVNENSPRLAVAVGLALRSFENL
jgi:type IV pilus assembly protein PilM